MSAEDRQRVQCTNADGVICSFGEVWGAVGDVRAAKGRGGGSSYTSVANLKKVGL